METRTRSTDSDDEMQETFKRSCQLPSSSVGADVRDMRVVERSPDGYRIEDTRGSFHFHSMNELLKHLHLERQERLQKGNQPCHTLKNHSLQAPASSGAGSGGYRHSNGVSTQHADTSSTLVSQATQAGASVDQSLASSPARSGLSRKRNRRDSEDVNTHGDLGANGNKRHRSRQDKREQ